MDKISGQLPELTIFSLSSKPSLQREQNILEVLEDIFFFGTPIKHN